MDGRRAGPTCCGGARPIRLSATCVRMLRCPYRNMLKGKAFNNLVGSYRHNGLLDEPTRRIWSLQGGCWPGGENWRRLLAQGGHRAWLLPGQRCRHRSPTTLVQDTVSPNWIWLAPATSNVAETIPKVKVQDPTFEVLEAASSDGYVRARPESR